MKSIYLFLGFVYLPFLLFAQTGNVGVGTNTPAAKLDVSASDKGILIPRIALTGTDDVATVTSPDESELIYNTATAGSGSTAVTPGFYFWDSSEWVRIKVGAEGEDHDWYESGGTAPDDINDDIYTQGNVGIGTASPDQSLELSGGGIQINGSYGIGFNGAIPSSADVTGDRIKFYYDNDLFGTNADGLVIEKSDGNGNDPDGGIAFANKGQDNIREIDMVVRGSGNVGIGTTSPSQKLHVEGNIRVTDLTDGVVTADGSGNFSVTSLTGNTQDVLLGDGTFGPGAAFGDNLGDHNATTDLEMNEHEILLRNASGSVYGVGFDAWGGTQLALTSDDVISFTESDGNTEKASWSMNNGTFAFDYQLRAYDASGLSLEDDAGNLGVHIEDGGQVGIGTTSPGYTLETVSGGTISVNDGYVRNVKGFYLKDWDDDSGGSDNKYRLLGRDGAFQFYNGGVVVGNYNNNTWSDLSDGTLIVEGSAGIGTTSPSTRLHLYTDGVGAGVTDMLRIELNRGDFGATPSGPAILFKDQDGNNSTNEARIKMMTVNDTDYGDNDEAASNLIFETTNGGTASDKMIITGRGDVGIGTINPTEKLDVNGYIALQGKHAFRGNDSWLRLNQAGAFTNGTYTPGLFRADGGYQVDGRTVIDNSGRYFYVYTGGNYSKFGAVNTNGFGLDAQNNGEWDFLQYEGQAYTNRLYLGYNYTNGYIYTYNTNEPLYIDPNGSGNIYLQPNSSDGKVGIGTTSPGYDLHVYSSSALGSGGTVIKGESAGSSGSGNTGSISNTSNNWAAMEGHTYAYDGSGTKGLHLPTSGSGYGIYGVTNNPSVAWAGYFSGDIFCAGTYWGSDRRFKKNMQSLGEQDILEKLLQLNPQVYEYDTEKFPGMGFTPGKKCFGFIAQDLEKVFPEVVATQKGVANPYHKAKASQETVTEKGFYLVDYVSMIPLLVEAIKEQQKTIESLESTVEQLKNN